MANMTIKEAIKWQESFKRTYKGFPAEVDDACDMAIQALKAYHTPASQKQFILCETIEREISEPVFFNSYEDAYQEMRTRFFKAFGVEDSIDVTDDELLDDLDEETGYISEWSAYCENANHDNCDWKIFEIGGEKS